MQNKLKFMISQPMGGLTDEKIKRVREEAVKKIEADGNEVVDTIVEFSDAYLKRNGVHKIPLHYLGVSIMKMATCDAVYFCKGWENARGCRVEHEAAREYGLYIVEEN